MKNYILTTLVILTFIFNGQRANAQIGPITEICLVTVDTTSSYNIIVWDRTAQISNLTIDSIKIYRTSILNGDSLIATVDFDSLSQYEDHGANPNLQSWKYRISGVDSLGNEGPMSLPHRTMHFSLLAQGDSIKLLWTPYVGKSLNHYRCWADSTGSTNWDLVNSTTNATDTSWWDNMAPIDWSNLDYLVDVDWNFTCTSTKQQSHNTTRSNRATMSGQTPTKVDVHTIENIKVYPNPTNSEAKVVFSSPQLTDLNITVVDINGKIVQEVKNLIVYGQNTYQLNTTQLVPGVYSVIFTTSDSVYSTRMIKL